VTSRAYEIMRRQRDAESRRLAEINRRNRDRFQPPPLPKRAPVSDGRSAGGVVDDKFGRR
jgi:hypothetical protein